MQYHALPLHLLPPMRMPFSAKFPAATRIALAFFALATITGAGIPVETLQKGCRGLLSGRRSAAAAEATGSISSWIKMVPESGSGGIAAKDDPTKAVFKEAENPVWCARSIEGFILTNEESFPESLSDTELLPLWWASVHPAAEPRHKEWVRTRLSELKSQKAAAAVRTK